MDKPKRRLLKVATGFVGVHEGVSYEVQVLNWVLAFGGTHAIAHVEFDHLKRTRRVETQESQVFGLGHLANIVTFQNDRGQTKTFMH